MNLVVGARFVLFRQCLFGSALRVTPIHTPPLPYHREKGRAELAEQCRGEGVIEWASVSRTHEARSRKVPGPSLTPARIGPARGARCRDLPKIDPYAGVASAPAW
jgi:hypothetical protein